MSGKTFYAICGFTIAFMLGMLGSWTLTRQYLPTQAKRLNCPHITRRAPIANPAPWVLINRDGKPLNTGNHKESIYEWQSRPSPERLADSDKVER
ncbi:MAG: hypothetical protein AB1489_17945 [Acidobacteriota bacterium]